MKEWIWPIIVFVLICAIGFGARTAIGTIYSSGEAIALLESLQQSGLFVGSATATASATTLALMLTLIGMVRRADEDFSHATYENIGRVAKLTTAALMSSLVLLLILAFPVGEFDGIPKYWYPALYEGLFAGITVTIGLLAATVALLYRTVHYVIAKVTPEDEPRD